MNTCDALSTSGKRNSAHHENAAEIHRRRGALLDVPSEDGLRLEWNGGSREEVQLPDDGPRESAARGLGRRGIEHSRKLVASNDRESIREEIRSDAAAEAKAREEVAGQFLTTIHLDVLCAGRVRVDAVWDTSRDHQAVSGTDSIARSLGVFLAPTTFSDRFSDASGRRAIEDSPRITGRVL